MSTRKSAAEDPRERMLKVRLPFMHATGDPDQTGFSQREIDQLQGRMLRYARDRMIIGRVEGFGGFKREWGNQSVLRVIAHDQETHERHVVGLNRADVQPGGLFEVVRKEEAGQLERDWLEREKKHELSMRIKRAMEREEAQVEQQRQTREPRGPERGGLER